MRRITVNKSFVLVSIGLMIMAHGMSMHVSYV